VRASRDGFLSAEYGQKRWNSAGAPVLLEADGNIFLDIRLLRYSAIGGTLLDENDEGLPGHEVLAYRTTQSIELVAHSTSDERGIYRLFGLEPGTYVVRTAGDQSNDESYLPTFSKETAQRDQARTVELLPDQEINEIDVRPLPGRLFSLSVSVNPPVPVPSITLVSELGRKTVKGSAYRFTRLAPGDYEVFAQSPAEPEAGEPYVGAYQRLSLGADTSVSLVARQSPAGVTVTGAPANASCELRFRHADLAGTGPTSSIPVRNGAATVPIGHWEVMLQPPAGTYVSRVSGVFSIGRLRPDGWQEMVSPSPLFGGLRFTVTAGASAIYGTLKGAEGPVAGAPVYLEAYNVNPSKRLADLRTAISGAHGQYRFSDLAPGAYRILGTFEYLSPDINAMTAAGAELVTVDAHSETSRDLELYTIR
jgi:hypothetical protein